jgi:transposase
MRKELDYGDLFARWAKLGEKLDDEWRENLLQSIENSEDQIVAYNLNNAILAGSNGVCLFRGVYISWDEDDIFLGPYKTFEEAADAAGLFSVTDVTEKIWVDSRILKRKISLSSPRSPSRSARRSPSSARQSKEFVTAWRKAAEDFGSKMRASGGAVRVWTRPLGRKGFLATFVPTSQVMRKALRSDREIVLAALRKNRWVLEHVAEKFKVDREIVLAAVKQWGLALEYAAKSLQSDREIVLAAVKKNGNALEHAAEKLKADREIVLAALNQNGTALKYAAEKFKADREIVLAAVKQWGIALEYAAKSLQSDREIVLSAVNQTGIALKYAAEKLKADREIVLAAVRQNGWALKHAAENFKTDREFMLAAVRENGSALKHAAKVLSGYVNDIGIGVHLI